MSDTMDVQMPDGTVIYGVPRNIKRADIAARWKASRPASPESVEKLENERTLAAETENPGLVGLGAGGKNAGEGILQGLSFLGQISKDADPSRWGIGPKPQSVDWQSLEAASRERVKETNELTKPLTDRSGAAAVAKFGGEAAPGFLFPQSRGGALARFAYDTGVGAAQGAMSPLEPGQSRMAATAGGTIGSAVPSGAANTARAMRNTGGLAQEMHTLSRRYGVDLTAGELSGKGGLQRLETILEKVPYLGIGGFRKKQSAQVVAAAKKLRDQFDVGASDIGEELQSGLERVYQQNKGEVGKLYDRVDQLSKGVDDPVLTTNRRGIAADLLKAEAALGPSADQQLVKYLEAHVSGEPMTFDAARKLRSRLWDEVRQAEKKAINGSVSDAEVALRTKVAQSLEQDIDEWAERAGTQNKELLSAYRQASHEFKYKVAPFKDRDIRKALQTDDTDTIVGTFLKRDRPKLADKLLSKTDERTQTAAKFYVLDNAFKAAESLPDTEFSPLVFARELEQLKSTNKVIFSEAEQKELHGFVKLMHSAQRAGKYRENVPTGNRVAEVGALGGTAALGALAVKNPPMAATIAGGAKTLSLLLTTDAGRSILTDVSRAGERSPAMNRLLFEARREVERIVERSGGAAGAEVAR
jgi:hypothetical protein